MQTDIIARKEQDSLEVDRPDGTPLMQVAGPKKARIYFSGNNTDDQHDRHKS